MKGILKAIRDYFISRWKEVEEERYESKSCGDMVSHSYGKDKFGRNTKTCQGVIDDIYRPFANSDSKYYPHHGLYKMHRWDGAVSSTKGEAPVVPCGMGDKKPKGLHIREFEYEVTKNIMNHHTTLSNGERYHSIVTFPKTTDSYLFGGIIKASNMCLDTALHKRIASKIDCT